MHVVQLRNQNYKITDQQTHMTTTRISICLWAPPTKAYNYIATLGAKDTHDSYLLVTVRVAALLVVDPPALVAVHV